jgi:hypothetical protein
MRAPIQVRLDRGRYRMKGIGQGKDQYDNRKSLAIALIGASISTVSLLLFSGIFWYIG